MSENVDRRAIVVVDDDHEYKTTLASNLSEFEIHFWGCRAEKCEICNADQPFGDAVDFIRCVNARAVSQLVGIVLDVNEYSKDEYSITHILPDLKSDIQLRDIPVIVYSAKYLPEQGRKAMAAGAAAYYDMALTRPREAADIIRKHALP